MSEHDIRNRILLEVGRGDVRLFNNNVGMGWAGKFVYNRNGEVLLRNARPLHAGLCEGSGDLIGPVTIEITPEMVGRKVAVFASLEVKTKVGRTSQEQENFLAMVQSVGGIAAVVRSPDDARHAIEQWRDKKG